VEQAHAAGEKLAMASVARARITGISAPLLTGGGDNVKRVMSILARDTRHVERFRGLLLRGVSKRFLRAPASCHLPDRSAPPSPSSAA